MLENVGNTERKFFYLGQKKIVDSKEADRYLISFMETIIWKQEIAPLVYIRSEFTCQLNFKKKRRKTSQVTTNKFNQHTISKNLPAMTLEDNTSSINCMQQLQLNLTQSRLSPAGCNKTTVMMPAMELRLCSVLTFCNS